MPAEFGNSFVVHSTARLGLWLARRPPWSKRHRIPNPFGQPNCLPARGAIKGRKSKQATLGQGLGRRFIGYLCLVSIVGVIMEPPPLVDQRTATTGDSCKGESNNPLLGCLIGCDIIVIQPMMNRPKPSPPGLFFVLACLHWIAKYATVDWWCLGNYRSDPLPGTSVNRSQYFWAGLDGCRAGVLIARLPLAWG